MMFEMRQGDKTASTNLNLMAVTEVFLKYHPMIRFMMKDKLAFKRATGDQPEDKFFCGGFS
jgi:hypothetical protein